MLISLKMSVGEHEHQSTRIVSVNFTIANLSTDRTARKHAMTYPPSSSDERGRERFPARCFWCDQPGHIQRDCPHRNRSASSTQRPPVTHGHTRAEGREERSSHRNYRDRSTGDLRTQTLRNTTDPSRETRSKLHETRRQEPPTASRKASKRRSRSPLEIIAV